MPETFQFLWKIRKARGEGGEGGYGTVYLKGDSVCSVWWLLLEKANCNILMDRKEANRKHSPSSHCSLNDHLSYA